MNHRFWVFAKLAIPLFFIITLINPVYAWWNASYTYRVQINITEQAGKNLYDYQVRLNVTELFPWLYLGRITILHFDECSGDVAYDSSDNKYSVNIYGNPIWTQGVEDCALDLDGSDDYVSLETIPLFNDAIYTRTVTIWFKPRDVSGLHMIYEEGGNVNGINIYIDDGKLCYGFWSETNNFDGVFSCVNITADEWHFAGYSLDTYAGYALLFLDGEVVGNLTIPTNIASHSDAGAIGRLLGTTEINNVDYDDSTDPMYFNGIVDEFRVYERPLIESELKRLYCVGAKRLNATEGYDIPAWCVDYYSTASYKGNDFRFTYYNQTDGSEVEIPHYQETEEIYWVKVPYIPANNISIIYLYYGDPNVTSTSDPNLVFEVFEDFNDDTYHPSITLNYREKQNGAVCFYYGSSYYIRVNGLQLPPESVYLRVEYDIRRAISGSGDTDTVVRVGDSSNSYTIVSDANCYNDYWFRAYDLISDNYQRHVEACGSWSASNTLSSPVWWELYDVDSDNGGFCIDNLVIRKWIDPEPTYSYGQQEVGIQYGIEWIYPQPNSYINTAEFPIRFRIYSDINEEYTKIELYLDGDLIHTFYNIQNNTTLEFNVSNVAEGQHTLYIIAFIDDLYLESAHMTFTVDFTPPTINIISPVQNTIRLHYQDPCMELSANATDNFKLDSCVIELWNNTTVECGSYDICFDPQDGDSLYSFRVVAVDAAGNSNTEIVNFLIDFSQGSPTITSINVPDRVPAVPFNISVTVQCDDDWCDTLTGSITLDPACVLHSQNPYIYGDLEKYDSAVLYWTVECDKADVYNFDINVSLANGNFTTTSITMYPPYFNISINPTEPTDNDNIDLIVYPYGYGTQVTFRYRVTIYRDGTYINLVDNTATVPTDTQTVLYTVNADDTRAGDVLIFEVTLEDPVRFYDSKELNVTVSEFQPPAIYPPSLKYQDIAPHDDNQQINVTIIDNTIVSNATLYLSIEGPYLQYQTISINKHQETVIFNITHNSSLIDKMIYFIIEACDEFNNCANSTVYSYKVVEDVAPSIEINSPVSGAYYNKTNILFTFKPHDDFSETIICVVDGFAPITVGNGEWVSKEYVFGEGLINTSIACSDEMNNTNTIDLSFTVDITNPAIENLTYKVIQESKVNFTMIAKDNIALDRIVKKIYINGTEYGYEEKPLSGAEANVTFLDNLEPFAGLIVKYIFVVYDKAGNSYTTPELAFAVSKPKTIGGPVKINAPPVVTIIDPPTIITSLILPIKFKVTDESPTVSCILQIDNEKILLGEVPTGEILIKNVTVKPGEIYYSIICTDPEGLQGFSGIYSVKVKPEVKAPMFFAKEAYSKIFSKEKESKYLAATAAVSLFMMLAGLLTYNLDLIVAGVIGLTTGIQAVYNVIAGNIYLALGHIVLSLAVGILYYIIKYKGIIKL